MIERRSPIANVERQLPIADVKRQLPIANVERQLPIADAEKQLLVGDVFVCLVYFINPVKNKQEKRRESHEGDNDEA